MWCAKCDKISYTKMCFHIERFRLLDQYENTEKEPESAKVSCPIPS
jgi:hypothetical protein